MAQKVTVWLSLQFEGPKTRDLLKTTEPLSNVISVSTGSLPFGSSTLLTLKVRVTLSCGLEVSLTTKVPLSLALSSAVKLSTMLTTSPDESLSKEARLMLSSIILPGS